METNLSFARAKMQERQSDPFEQRQGVLKEHRSHDKGYSETDALEVPRERRLPSVAATITPVEYEELLRLQSEMAARMVMGELTKSEILHLQMVRWAIDRAEAELYGPALDRLTLLARLQEQLASEVQRLVVASGR